MPWYIVKVPEEHVSHMQIEADSPEDARAKVADGEGLQVQLEFVQSFDVNAIGEWEVSEETEELQKVQP